MRLELEIPYETNHPTILWFDPGGTTGWAAYHKGYFHGGQIGPQFHHLELDSLIEYWSTVQEGDNTQEFILGTESFEFRQTNGDKEDERKGLELVSCEYIGVMRSWTFAYNLDLKTQTASEGKGSAMATDIKLERLGLLVPGQKHVNRHMLDALRHLLHYMIVRRSIRKGLTDKMKKVRP